MVDVEYISVKPQISREKNALKNLEDKINNSLKDNNEKSFVKSITDSFAEDKQVDDIELIITFSNPINIANKDLKSDINAFVSSYITNGNGMNKNLTYFKPTDDYSSKHSQYKVYFEPIEDDSSDKQDDNKKLTTKITYFYKIILEESTENLLNAIKKDDFRHSNKLLSKILKEKIDKKLDLVFKK